MALARYTTIVQHHPHHPNLIELALMSQAIAYSAVLNERFAINIYLASISVSVTVSVAGLILLANQVFMYDWLLSVSEEVEIISRSGLSWSIAVYISSRYASCFQTRATYL